MSRTRAQDLARTGSDVVAALGGLVDVLERLRAIAVDAAAVLGAPGPRLEQLAPLRPQVLAVLDDLAGTVVGCGVVPRSGLLTDAPYWLEWWWRRRQDQAPEALRVVLDPERADFFAYPDAAWFTEPMRDGESRLIGPYVDHACTNRYAFTLATPIVAGDAALGVAAADVPWSEVDRRVLPALAGHPEPVALVNAQGRVITSTSAHAWPGERLTGPRSPLPAGDAPASRLVASWGLTSPDADEGSPPSRTAHRPRGSR